MKQPYIVSILFLCFFYNIAFSQVEGWMYKYDTSVKVYGYSGIPKPLAWCGGFDDPKFAMGDLNNDGKQDLVVYDRGVSVRTFINTIGSNYVYAPQYELNFPPVVNYLALVDYNRDGVPDLVQQGLTGIPGFDIWRGYYNASNQLCFTHYQQLYYDNSGSGLTNAYCNPSDVPAVLDLDHDGDIDFLAYEQFGAFIYYFKNVQVEEGLPKDTVKIKLKDQCWGKIQQSYKLSYYLNTNCNNSNLVLGPGEKTTHSGNAICILDMDGDGDMDYLGGNVSFANVVCGTNGRIPYHPGNADSIASQDTTWQSGGHILNMPYWPAIFNLDIDHDGKADLLISPNSSSENYKCIAYYKNTGTASVPNFSYQEDTFLIDKTIDVGSAAYPMFFDYDKDGKPDLFIGSDGYYQPGGTYIARIAYYKNTSTAGNPSFTLQTSNFLSIDTSGFRGTALAVGDLDNDGKKDLIIGHTDGSFSFYTNTASSDAVQSIWQLSQLSLKDASNATINVGGNAAPFIYDLDKDGKPDLITGEYSGYLQYYQNISTTPGNIKLKRINNKIGGVSADGGGPGTYSYPFIGKMDTTGKDFMLVGSSSGLLYRYDGFQSGDTSHLYSLKDTSYCWIDTTFLYHRHPGTYIGTYMGFRSAPAIADVDGDGLYEMVVGDIFGGLKLYRQDSNLHVNVPQQNLITRLNIYPNPATNIAYLSWDTPLSSDGIITVFNITGQEKLQKNVKIDDLTAQFDIASLTSGIYIVMLKNNNSCFFSRLSVVK